LSVLSIIDQIVVAYFIADFLTAVFHFATDQGWGTKRIVAQFLKHHHEPWTMTFDLEPLLAGLPIGLVGLFVAPWFFMPLGLFVAFAQVPHYFTHHAAPNWIRTLQRWRIILPPSAHQSHHTTFDRDFSVISGWSNPLLNWLLMKAGFISSGGAS
jgi:hypothetical protein